MSEEIKVEEHKEVVEERPQRISLLSRFRDNPWILSTIVLAVLLVVVFAFGGVGNKTINANVISEKAASDKVLSFLNGQVQEGEVTLNDIAIEDGYYKLNVDYQGQTIPVYVTLDGEKLVNFVPLTDEVPTRPNAPSKPAAPVEPIDIDYGNAPFKGNENAPVTIVEFSDYQCPFCGRHVSQTVPLIDENYIATGKVKYVFMNFPLGFHPHAQKAAEAAMAVGAQLGNEGYWKMHDKLFGNQDSLSVENYKKWARELGVDGAQFDDDLDSGKFEDAVKADLAYGQTVGVKGTPATFVNGKFISGAQPYSVFEQAIEAELAKLGN